MTTARRRIVRLVLGRGQLCPICGHDNACCIFTDTNWCLCLRVQEGCQTHSDGTPLTAKNGMGFLHRLTPDTRAKLPKGIKLAKHSKKLTHIEIKAILKIHRDALTARRLTSLSRELGLSEKSLEVYGVGYDPETGCYSFPMYDGEQKYVGIRLRSLDGKVKACVRGSTNGLFIPQGYKDRQKKIHHDISDDPYPLVIVMPEGPTSSAAAYDLGFNAIGRPSNVGGIEYLRELLVRGDRQDVALVADRDETKWLKDRQGNLTVPFWPGWEGALATAESILPCVGRLRVIQTPKGIKDLRKWLLEGGFHGMVVQLLSEAQTVDRQWIHDKTEQVREWKRKLKRPENKAA